MSERISLPKYDDLFSSTLKVPRTLGGSGAIDEINDAIAAAIGVTQAQADVTYSKSGAPVLPDRMSWARSFLKLPGLVANPTRGVWVLTEAGQAAVDKPNTPLCIIGTQIYGSRMKGSRRG